MRCKFDWQQWSTKRLTYQYTRTHTCKTLWSHVWNLSCLKANKCGAFVGATCKPPPLALISQGWHFFTVEETSRTPVVRVAQQRCGRSRPPALLRWWAIQAISRQVRVHDRQATERIISIISIDKQKDAAATLGQDGCRDPQGTHNRHTHIPQPAPSSTHRNLLLTFVITPTAYTSTVFARRAFNYTAPTTWNSLSADILTCDSESGFKRLLKTHYFNNCFNVAWLTHSQRLCSSAYGALQICMIMIMITIVAPMTCLTRTFHSNDIKGLSRPSDSW